MKQYIAMLQVQQKALACGPKCQRDKVLEELNQKYLDAQTNLQIAPTTLDQTKKNYYVFKEGRPYYDNMLQKELKVKADNIAESITTNFNEELANAQTLDEALTIDEINSLNSIELYNQYVAKNVELRAIISESKGDVLTNDRKTYYETQEYDSLQKWRTRFLWIYYILVIVFALSLLFIQTKTTTFNLIITLILLVVYPFIIDGIVQTIWGFMTKIFGYLPKNVYNNL